jgi:hypothetical protein
MAQIFHRSTNTLAKVSIFSSVILIAAGIWLLLAIDRSPYVNQAGVVREQEVPFSHRRHVKQLGLDCRYCHTSVEESHFAGIPPTKTCMTCHSQIHTSAELLEPVRESWRTGESLEWIRVHDLADFVYFNHSIHVTKGVGCETCHGPVEEMALMWRENSLQMEWCLDCHRQPEKYVRPRDEVFTTNWEPEIAQEELGAALVKEYNIEKLTNCSVCHR